MARAGALAEVDSVLAAARAGRGTLVAVTGEPGIGKTRLAEAAADRAALAGPARDPGGGPADPEGARSQLSFDLAEVIAAAAQPVLVVIDDANQADPSSLRLLAELGPALRAMPAAVLVTARDGDQAWQGRLDERGALLRSDLVITLPPFTADDVAGLVASPTGAPPAPDLVRVIAERSAGNPLLVTELTRQLSRQGGDAAAARAAVPEPVRVITSARLAELSVPTQSVLKAAAVLGARFRRDVLASVTGVPPGELAGALATGRDARLLEPAGPGEDRFRHELVRDAVYDAIPEADREELHVQAGGLLAALAARGRDVDDAEAAYHLVRAGRPWPGRPPSTPAARATGPAVVRAGDDARRGGRQPDSRAHGLLHRRLEPGPPGRARGLRHPDPPVAAGRRPWPGPRWRSATSCGTRTGRRVSVAHG